MGRKRARGLTWTVPSARRLAPLIPQVPHFSFGNADSEALQAVPTGINLVHFIIPQFVQARFAAV
jgi:hypothetical protein